MADRPVRGTILRLAGLTGFTSWRALTPETVAPRRLPDGLIEARFPGEEKPRLVLVEVEAFPGKGVDEQVFDDLMLLAVERRALPEVILLVMRPRGKQEVAGVSEMTSPSGLTRLGGSWPVVRLWEQDADALLAAGDAGLVPLVPLARSSRPAEEVLAACRDRLTAVPDPTERAGLIAVLSIVVEFVSPGMKFWDLFAGAKTMVRGVLEDVLMSPGMSELREMMLGKYAAELKAAGEAEGRAAGEAEGRAAGEAEGRLSTLRESIAAALEARFGPVPADRLAPLAVIADEARLKALLALAVTCPDVDAFAAGLATPAGGEPGPAAR